MLVSLVCIGYVSVMTRTTKKTPVAVLRFIIGEKAQGFADLLGCTVHTINSLETERRLKLSEEMAQRMSHETGIAVGWLLAGNAKAPPVTAWGEPFTPEAYQRHRAKKLRRDKVPPVRLAVDFVNFAGQLRGILSRANRGSNYALPAWKVARFLASLAKEYGDDSSGVTWAVARDGMRGDVADADRYFAEMDRALQAGGHDVVDPHKAVAPAKKPSARSSSRPRRKA